MVRAQSSSIGQPHTYGLMIEVDGVLVDIHKDCHRVAFNQAFEVSSKADPRCMQDSCIQHTIRFIVRFVDMIA